MNDDDDDDCEKVQAQGTTNSAIIREKFPKWKAHRSRVYNNRKEMKMKANSQTIKKSFPISLSFANKRKKRMIF
jgi:hypothetical protein